MIMIMEQIKKYLDVRLIEIKMEALKYDNRKVTRIIRMNKKFVDREGDVYKKSFVKDSGFEKVMKRFYSEYSRT